MTESNVRKIDYPNTGGGSRNDGESPIHDRVETGAVQFGDDWPGYFMRGDSAFHHATQIAMLEHHLKKFHELFEEMCRKAGESEEDIETRLRGVKLDCFLPMQVMANLRKNIVENTVVGTVGEGTTMAKDIYFEEDVCPTCGDEGEVHDADFSDGDSDQQMRLKQDTLRPCPDCKGKQDG